MLPQYVTCFGLRHRFQLENVAHQQQLFASERLPAFAGVESQNLINQIDCVGPNH